jgi:hypothetical protein
MVIDWGRSSAASCLEKRRIRLTGCWQRLESANVSRFRRSCSESAFTFGGSIADPTYLRRVVELDRTVQTWRKPSCTDQRLLRLFQEIKNGAGGRGLRHSTNCGNGCGHFSFSPKRICVLVEQRTSQPPHEQRASMGLRLRAGVNNFGNQCRRLLGGALRAATAALKRDRI